MWLRRYGIDGEEIMTTNNEDRYVYKEGEDLPPVYLLFDPRGEYHGFIANSAISVKKGDQFEYMMQFAGDLGQVQQMKMTAVIKDVDEEQARQLFQSKDYLVVSATEEDFQELEREFDKLQTIKGGESTKYK